MVHFVDSETKGKKSSNSLVFVKSQPDNSDQTMPTRSAGNLITISFCLLYMVFTSFLTLRFGYALTVILFDSWGTHASFKNSQCNEEKG